MFFLELFDRSLPLSAPLSEKECEKLDDHAVGGLEDAGLYEAKPLFACACRGGILLSINTNSVWSQDRIGFTVTFSSSSQIEQMEIDNFFDINSADTVCARVSATEEGYSFENWDRITGGAMICPQVSDWLTESSTFPGLEQVVMRKIAAAAKNQYQPDGTIVKKLTGASASGLSEVRAWYNGSNNVRLLFLRRRNGTVVFGYAGIKTSENWYDHAITQAVNGINGIT